MINLAVKIVKSVNEISQDNWQRLFGGHLLRRYGYYKTIEESDFKKFRFFYIQFFQDNNLIAISPGFIMDFPIDFSLPKRYKRITKFISKICYCLINIKTVFIGMPMSCQCDIAVEESKISPLFILEETISQLKAIAKKEHALLIALKDFPKKYSNFLKKRNFIEIETYPNARLEINFNSFEDYIKTLSYTGRYDYRRKLRKYAKLIPLTMEIKKDCYDCIDKIYELYTSTVKNNELHFDTVKKEYFLNISRNLKNEVLFFIWRLNGKIVAFNLCLFEEKNMIGDLIGFDYEIAYKYNIYFVTLKDKIEWCIRNGVKTLDEGTFTLELKKRLKFKFYNNYFYMKPNIKLFEPIAKIITPFFAPSNKDEQLKLLKKAKKI